MSIRTIVVGTDGSENAAMAIAWAVDLALATDAEVVAVHSMGLLLHPDAGAPVPSYGRRDEMRKLFEDVWCQPLRDSGVRHRAIFLEDNPVSAMLDTAETVGADLIVVGSRGHGGFPDLRLGSTSHQLLEYSDRPVAVVPRDWSG